MFANASSSDTGTGALPDRRRTPRPAADIDRSMNVSYPIPAAQLTAIVDPDSGSSSGGVLNGISSSIRPEVQSASKLWEGTSWVLQPKIAWPPSKSSIPEVEPVDARIRVKLEQAQNAFRLTTKKKRDIVTG